MQKGTVFSVHLQYICVLHTQHRISSMSDFCLLLSLFGNSRALCSLKDSCKQELLESLHSHWLTETLVLLSSFLLLGPMFLPSVPAGYVKIFVFGGVPAQNVWIKMHPWTQISTLWSQCNTLHLFFRDVGCRIVSTALNQFICFQAHSGSWQLTIHAKKRIRGVCKIWRLCHRRCESCLCLCLLLLLVFHL